MKTERKLWRMENEEWIPKRKENVFEGRWEKRLKENEKNIGNRDGKNSERKWTIKKIRKMPERKNETDAKIRRSNKGRHFGIKKKTRKKL